LVANMSQDPYLSRKDVSKSYRPRSYVMSPGLQRARAPFRFQNALTGVVLAGFATAVWAYSIRAVKQDDFSDVDEEAREMMKGKTTGDASSSVGPGGGVSSPSWSLVVGTVDPDVNVSRLGSESTGVRPHSHSRGVLAPMLDRAFPHLLDPTRKTLVWGAPPVGDLGRVCLRGSNEERR